MKKCVLFFIGLILALIVAMVTEERKTGTDGNNLAKSELDTQKNLAENKAVPLQEAWKR